MNGFRRIACAWLAAAFKRLGRWSLVLPRGCERIAGWFEARAQVDRPREWQPRLWDRGLDPRSDTRERRP